MGSAPHVSVLLGEVLAYLQPQGGGVYVDGTLGLGGHAEAILEASAPGGRVIGFEWDQEAAALAAERLARFGDRIRIIPASYAELAGRLEEAGELPVDGLLLDLGVSSLQLDRPERGFSFRHDAPLDMRMSADLSLTGADLVARLGEEELADVFYRFGEERQARRIARFVVEERKKTPITTTRQLAELVARAIPRKYHPRRIHVATRVFQALRIAVNREFDNIVQVLAQAPSVLKKGGVLCVITFHSLEDRIVKRGLMDNPAYELVTRKPVEPSPEEIQRNPRARSARLRVARIVTTLDSGLRD
ncbi:ribosomal RNA small subunit methyltransferase H [Desulfolithobacter dissulfuricans]|uniref:Ribosomal RNA small subunit methyltransferase H n=1 Tax=Desulfolithobacter dissulfuricans TaxID=2795293 RepID=A0A915U605_9BACT|nr:16S rRNA (cytosine(1402)-N(4))-methyltransferase RsmH [Desulfolithobacter dissulfuricans]BCO09697.1 ribosomal RNA small subunit methyltransferase H [Desulfolithobacter dissulfuricans]